MDQLIHYISIFCISSWNETALVSPTENVLGPGVAPTLQAAQKDGQESEISSINHIYGCGNTQCPVQAADESIDQKIWGLG